LKEHHYQYLFNFILIALETAIKTANISKQLWMYWKNGTTQLTDKKKGKSFFDTTTQELHRLTTQKKSGYS